MLNTFSYPFGIIIEKPMYLNWIKQYNVLRETRNQEYNGKDIIEKYIEEEKIFILTN